MINGYGYEYEPFEPDFVGSNYEGQDAAKTTVYFEQDYLEQQKFGQFYGSNNTSGGSAERPYWEGLAIYGVTRAIDAAFGKPLPGSGSKGETFAGQNGRTYDVKKAGGALADDNLVLLIGLGALAYMMAS